MFFTELLSMTHSAKYEVEESRSEEAKNFKVCKSCELAKQLNPCGHRSTKRPSRVVGWEAIHIVSPKNKAV